MALGVALSAGPLIVVALSAVFGVGRLLRLVWPLGVSTLVFIGGVFARGRTLAAVIAVGLAVGFALAIALLPPADRLSVIRQQGWLILIVTYLWAKAANSSYWSSRPARERVSW